MVLITILARVARSTFSEPSNCRVDGMKPGETRTSTPYPAIFTIRRTMSAKGRFQRNAIAGRQGSKKSRRRIADEHGVLYGEVQVIEDPGDKSLWQNDSVGAGGIRA